jgi:hypothetical protein
MTPEAVTGNVRYCWNVTPCSLVDGNIRYPFLGYEVKPDTAVGRLILFGLRKKAPLQPTGLRAGFGLVD